MTRSLLSLLVIDGRADGAEPLLPTSTEPASIRPHLSGQMPSVALIAVSAYIVPVALGSVAA
jgi:hypothetical protein